MPEKDPKSTENDWLYQQLEEKESIINSISDPLMVLDTKTYQILDVNQAFLKSYKTKEDEVLGRTCYEITHNHPRPCPELHGSEPCPLKESVLGRGPVHIEHVHKDREGGNVYVEISSYPLRDSDGEISRIVHLSRDVTDRRRAEEALKERLTRSENLASLGQLVAEITHEIKNPLMMIGGFAKQLFPPVDEETKIKKLTIITEQAARLEKLLAELKGYYSPKDLHSEPVNVKEVLEKIYSLVKEECSSSNIRIDMKMDETDLIVNWDPSRLEQVFLNVIKNSVEAMENGGNLAIAAKAIGDRVRITVEDDGCGIPKAHMDKILKSFFSTKSFGTGLGLSISKRYIDEHRGSSLSVKSEEGKGTTVDITLPLA